MPSPSRSPVKTEPHSAANADDQSAPANSERRVTRSVAAGNTRAGFASSRASDARRSPRLRNQPSTSPHSAPRRIRTTQTRGSRSKTSNRHQAATSPSEMPSKEAEKHNEGAGRGDGSGGDLKNNSTNTTTTGGSARPRPRATPPSLDTTTAPLPIRLAPAGHGAGGGGDANSRAETNPHVFPPSFYCPPGHPLSAPPPFLIPSSNHPYLSRYSGRSLGVGGEDRNSTSTSSAAGGLAVGGGGGCGDGGARDSAPISGEGGDGGGGGGAAQTQIQTARRPATATQTTQTTAAAAAATRDHEAFPAYVRRGDGITRLLSARPPPYGESVPQRSPPPTYDGDDNAAADAGTGGSTAGVGSGGGGGGTAADADIPDYPSLAAMAYTSDRVADMERTLAATDERLRRLEEMLGGEGQQQQHKKRK